MNDDSAFLKTIEQRLLWLSHWMIHNANHIRPKADGIKVGGHQASSASMVSIMTALYFSALRPEDRVAVKPHASPIFHAMHYLMGNQTREKMENFRGFGGVQSYRGTPTGIDLFKVLETGVLPVMDIGIAGKGGGQIGAGVVSAPTECFSLAAELYAARYRK